MAKAFELEIFAADRNFFDGSVQQVVVAVGDGMMGIKANHEPMLIAIDMGEIKIQRMPGEKPTEDPQKHKSNSPAELEEGAWEIAVVGRGSMEVADNRVTILVESAEYPWEIDVRRAEEAKARAEEELRQKHSRSEYEASQASLARALSRLRAVRDVNSV